MRTLLLLVLCLNVSCATYSRQAYIEGCYDRIVETTRLNYGIVTRADRLYAADRCAEKSQYRRF